jgi:hypothetical protein
MRPVLRSTGIRRLRQDYTTALTSQIRLLANKGTGSLFRAGRARRPLREPRTTAPIAEDDGRVTSAQSVLYAAASGVTIERVRAP